MSNPFDSDSISERESGPQKTVNVSFKTSLCKRDCPVAARENCTFYHTSSDRHLNYFGVNVSYSVEKHNEVMRWTTDRELRLRTLQRTINAGDRALDEFHKVLREAKDKGIWLQLPERDLV